MASGLAVAASSITAGEPVLIQNTPSESPLTESLSQALVIRSKHGASVMAKPAHHNRKGARNRATPLGLTPRVIARSKATTPYARSASFGGFESAEARSA